MFASRSPVGNFICVEVCCCQSCSCVHVEAAFGIHPSNIDIPSEFQKVDRQEEQRPQNVDRRHWHYNRKEVDIVTIMFDPNIVSSTRSITSSSRLPPDTEVEEDAQNRQAHLSQENTPHSDKTNAACKRTSADHRKH